MHFSDRELMDAFEADLASVRDEADFELPPLKRPATFGVFPWWPAAGYEWIHPDDVQRASEWIPSDRIFKREDQSDGWSLLSYGGQSIRVRPALWLEVKTDGFEIGDPVEVTSDGGRRTPLVARIHQTFWDRRERRVKYQLEHKGNVLHKTFLSDDFRMVKPIDDPITLRQLQMLERSYLR